MVDMITQVELDDEPIGIIISRGSRAEEIAALQRVRVGSGAGRAGDDATERGA
jgi:hypothetical protein